MAHKLIIANWKENPKTERGALEIFSSAAKAKWEGVDVVVCPPFIYLEKIAAEYRRLKSKKGLALGAQDVFWEEGGPFTGEIGPKMLRSVGVRQVIVGHSERRRWMHETDAMVNEKIKMALKDDLGVILCVGEPLPIRRRGINSAKRYIANQLKKDLNAILPRNSKLIAHISVAYEPIWSIGTGHNDNPKDAVEIASFIKETLTSKLQTPSSVRILYGGSVNSKNIRDYVQYKEIDGALVGGASLKGAEFKKIIEYSSKI